MIYLYNNKVVNLNEIWDKYIREINTNPYKTKTYEEREKDDTKRKLFTENTTWNKHS